MHSPSCSPQILQMLSRKIDRDVIGWFHSPISACSGISLTSPTNRPSRPHHNGNRGFRPGTPHTSSLRHSVDITPRVAPADAGRGSQITYRHFGHPRRSRLPGASSAPVENMRRTVGMREDFDWCTRAGLKGNSHSTSMHATSVL